MIATSGTEKEPAWVSFCISTYKRPQLLREQLGRISQQTFSNYNVVISDNDPEGSGRQAVENFNDPRIRYFHNEGNLGMVRSFNKSLERADTEFVVMVTDDDPVYPDMLEDFFEIVRSHPGHTIYCGCRRTGQQEGKIEIFDKNNFVYQLLHPGLTKSILWSSCVLRKDAALAIGGMPDYGSPHLADHAMLALCSLRNGGVMVNRMYSEFSSHTANFSKTNFELYYVGCREFYSLITRSFPPEALEKGGDNALIRHLESWFIAMNFNLRRFYAHAQKDRESFQKASDALSKILKLPFMRSLYPRYFLKRIVFYLKFPLYRLGILKK